MSKDEIKMLTNKELQHLGWEAVEMRLGWLIEAVQEEKNRREKYEL